MDYQYDIFISYRRNEETLRWIKEQFIPLLKLRVGMELDREPAIFLDEQIESGTSWPLALAQALGCSRILILLWSGNYLSSVWCAEELSHMLQREQDNCLRTLDRPHGLVVPAFIHDGDKFPSELGHIQHFEIQQCFNVRIAPGSKRAEELDAALAGEAPAIAHCIGHAPKWQPRWAQQAADVLFKQYHRRAAAQSEVPRFTVG